MVRIPRCMSTQHPDNVNSPFFAERPQLSGENEIQEAYYAFSHLGCDEQMWDCEGKEVDNFVVKKLLTKYGYFFGNERIGRDVFITLRVPNPTVEKADAKILLETLERIPRFFDIAKLVYGDDSAPVFEVILPMVVSSSSIDKLYRYYCDFVVGKQDRPIGRDGKKIGQWIGEFKPKSINVIPLFESMESLLDGHNITREYLQDKDVGYQRIFLARSDPALNYGLVCAVLLNKIALLRFHKLSEELGIGIHPILGVGSAPFRGNLRPGTVERVMEEYPSVHTFTIQSSFKYDNPHDKVREAIKKLRERVTGAPTEFNEERCLDIIGKCSRAYADQIAVLAPVINKVAMFVPSRRKRKLHLGVFGYSRDIGGITMPRAIKFTAALYSIGLPPEILGLNALDGNDVQFLREVYVNFDADLRDSLRYFNLDSGLVPKEIKEIMTGGAGERGLPVDFQQDEEHRRITDHIVGSLKRNETGDLMEHVLMAANLRGFIG